MFYLISSCLASKLKIIFMDGHRYRLRSEYAVTYFNYKEPSTELYETLLITTCFPSSREKVRPCSKFHHHGQENCIFGLQKLGAILVIF